MCDDQGSRSRGRRCLEAEGGQGLAEYGMIIALIAAACVAALTTFGSAITESAGFTSLSGVF